MGEEPPLVSACWESRAFNAFPLISQPLFEAGGVRDPLSGAVTCPGSLSLGGTRSGSEWSPRPSAPAHTCISLRGSGSLGCTGWGSSGPLLPEEQVPGVQVALTSLLHPHSCLPRKVSPVFLERRWGWLWTASWQGCGKWLERRAGAGHGRTQPKS